MPLTLLIVAEEKELESFEQVVKSCAKSVGPMKLFTSSKAVDAVGKLQQASQATGTVHAAFLHNRFTAPGKEEYSDALRKVLRDQHPETVVVCWGHVSKGGDQGKHYHHGLEHEDPASVAHMLQQIKSGELTAEWKKKGHKADAPRKSTDSPRPSEAAAARRKSLDRAPAPPAAAERRRSLDREGPPALGRRSASKPVHHEEEDVGYGSMAGMGGMGMGMHGMGMGMG
eukprot:CAMPEP_0202869018 /NCGR_PEP_ID=MMETSP1391-20130828/11616_1 /ASSEMBLY_ACC=CAM_ASM_000867 /TAXON_ID=1034604 /ORGANISM="Chlamydomonas leiostraca, Strain SAG 11-49" /LENGTH=227 /DNA_ID=CAMNT_0049549263 /DNA_START=111 /DNA_END=790 /DNA_ORIENTATION=+